MKYFYYLIILFIVACKPDYTAQDVVDKAIRYANLDSLNNATISFKFRNNKYSANRNNGLFELTKLVDKDTVIIKDVLSNNGFQRFVNDSLINLTKEEKAKYSNAVNSVHYFSVLPLGLNDSAVKKELLSSVKIKGKEYYKVKITFTEEGGGDDFDDIFLYWFSKDNFQLDYLAYKYHTNGGGIRFRDIKKEHVINDVRLLDYNNYKPASKQIDFYTIDDLYEKDELIKVSEIVLEDIVITPNR